MKIVNVIGGLGNQMFQYAFAIALKNAFPDEDVKLDIHTFKGYGLHNGFELDKIFKNQLSFSSLRELTNVAYPWFHYRLWQVGTRILPQKKGMTRDTDFPADFSMEAVADKSYFDGYWQAPKFFEAYRSQIVSAYKFPEISDDKNKAAIDFIKKDKTAFIHVRRGDYINHPFLGGICTTDYYNQAILRFINDYGFKQFIIMSNDIAWCRENLADKFSNSKVIYVDWNKGADSFRDMQLMTKCKGAVIANSSFSWWGAWLADTEVVICPTRWATDGKIGLEILPDSWIKI